MSGMVQFPHCACCEEKGSACRELGGFPHLEPCHYHGTKPTVCPCAFHHDHHRQSPPAVCCAGREWRLAGCPPMNECNCAICTGKQPCDQEHPVYGWCCEVMGHLKKTHTGANGGAWETEALQEE